MLQACEQVALLLGLDNGAFVNAIYANLAGAPPSNADRDYYAVFLQGSGGTLSQGRFQELVATSDLNADNIDLVGLQRTGAAFI